MNIYVSNFNSPIGSIAIGMTDNGLAAMEIGAELDAFAVRIEQRFKGDVIFEAKQAVEVRRQLTEYFDGERKTFDLPIVWSQFTPFQARVLKIQIEIPYGEIRTYGSLAARLGNPKAARAVGRAGATNPIPIVIPCHRVIGRDGTLRGYRAPNGVETKAWLLTLEGVMINFQSSFPTLENAADLENS